MVFIQDGNVIFLDENFDWVLRIEPQDRWELEDAQTVTDEAVSKWYNEEGLETMGETIEAELEAHGIECDFYYDYE